MTWSIVALDPDGSLGVAVASRFFAVGALCPYAASGIGAVATQALVNPLYAPAALAALERGDDPVDIVRNLTSADAGREHRQLHMIDKTGRTAAHTGSSCIDWCGHGAGQGYSLAGNMLTGPEVLKATAAAMEAHRGEALALRLLKAMAAGEAAGGDKRGKQAAALLIFATESYPALDLRVDDHAEPITELFRLYEKSFERFQPFVSCLPRRDVPAGITDRAVIEAEIERFQAARTKARPER